MKTYTKHLNLYKEYYFRLIKKDHSYSTNLYGICTCCIEPLWKDDHDWYAYKFCKNCHGKGVAPIPWNDLK